MAQLSTAVFTRTQVPVAMNGVGGGGGDREIFLLKKKYCLLGPLTVTNKYHSTYCYVYLFLAVLPDERIWKWNAKNQLAKPGIFFFFLKSPKNEYAESQMTRFSKHYTGKWWTGDKNIITTAQIIIID